MSGAKYGRESMHAPESEELRQDWEAAREGNLSGEGLRHLPGHSPTEWAPINAIHVVPAILPREGDGLNHEAIEQYKEDFDNLPPIEVQKDTFVLIGGLNRLEAARQLGRHTIQMVEEDVSDEMLWEAAFQSNRRHGVPMKLRERVNAARKALEIHPDWSDVMLSEWAGVNRGTIASMRNKTPQVSNPASSDGATPAPPVEPAARVGKDGKVRKMPDRKPKEPGAATGFNPVPKATPAKAPPAPITADPAAPEPIHGESPSVLARAIDSLDAGMAFELLLGQNARGMAGEVDEEMAHSALTVALRVQRWMAEYIGTLQERVNNPHHAGVGV